MACTAVLLYPAAASLCLLAAPLPHLPAITSFATSRMPLDPEPLETAESYFGTMNPLMYLPFTASFLIIAASL